MEYILIGKIINTHGVKGELKIDVYTDFIDERFKKDSKIYIGEKHDEVIVNEYRMHNGFMLLSLKDFDDINLILKYKNMNIYKSSDDIKPLTDGFYFRDLKDLDVYSENEKVGVVLYCESGISSNFIRVLTNDNREVLVPILKNFILNVDLKNNRINVIKMEGLL